MLEILHKTSRSVSFEIQNDLAYRTSEPYTIFLNGEEVKTADTNVVTLYDLLPDTSYQLVLKGGDWQELTYVTTKRESYTLNVKDFGAKGDGKANDTQAIQAALYACPRKGRVVIPPGDYIFHSLFFKSHTNLEIQKGARLQAIESTRERAILPGLTRDYQGGEYYLGSWEGNPLDCYAGLFTLLDVEDVNIYGEGVIEANASKSGFWSKPKEKDGAWRPRTIFMRRVKDVAVVGIKIKNSPSWTIHPMESRKLKFINASIENPWDSPNTDGINPESCRDVEIVGCHFSLGDDCIAIKSGKIYMAQQLGIPSEKIRIRNCFMEHGHGGVTLGSEIAGGVRDVKVSQCIFQDTDRGLRIKTRRGRGELSVVDKISFDNIQMNRVMAPFVLNMFYFCDPDGHSDYVQNKEDIGASPIDLPTLRRFSFKNIEVKDATLAGIFAYGLPERPIEEIVMKNVHIDMVALDKREGNQPAMMDGEEWDSSQVLFLKNVQSLTCRNVTIGAYETDGEHLENIGEEDTAGLIWEIKETAQEE